MKKTKVLVALSSVILLSLVGCGGRKPSSNPAGSSSTPGGEDKITPVNLEKVKTNVNGMQNVTLNESVFSGEVGEQSLGEGLPSIETFEGLEINYTMKIANNGDTERYGEAKMIAGYSNITKLAENLGISKETLLKRLGQQAGRYDAENDRAIAQEEASSGTDYQWYSTEEQQALEYSVENNRCRYVLDSDRDDASIDAIKTAVSTIIEKGKLDRKTSTITVDAKDIGDILGGEMDVGTMTLFIQNNYPKRLSAEQNGSKVAVSLYDYNKTTVQIPVGVKPEACDHDDYSPQYDSLGDGHRLYCNNCKKYLSAKENHALLDSNNHKYCTKCEEIVNTETMSHKDRYIQLEDEEAYFADFYLCKTNNKIYSSSYSLGSRSGSKTVKSSEDLYVTYWPNEEMLLVRKSYAPNDNALATPNTPETIGYACYKATKNTYEALSGVKASDFPSLTDGTFKNEDYAAIKAVAKVEKQVEAYYLSISHTTSSDSEAIDDCNTRYTSTCSVCNKVTNSYVSTNHNPDYTKETKHQVDDCHYEILCECTKCHSGVDAHYYGVIDAHKNATYNLVQSEIYLKLKYNLDYSSSYRYIEMTCPTCKETILYAISSGTDICQKHLRNEPISYSRAYKINSQGKITTTYTGYVDIPHMPDEYGVCKLCGEGSIVIKVAENVRVLVSYTLDNRGKITDIRNSGNGFDYMNDKFDNLTSDLTKVTYYADYEMTQTICSIIYSNSGKSIEILDASDNTVYKAEAGSPLPKING